MLGTSSFGRLQEITWLEDPNKSTTIKEVGGPVGQTARERSRRLRLLKGKLGTQACYNV